MKGKSVFSSWKLSDPIHIYLLPPQLIVRQRKEYYCARVLLYTGIPLGVLLGI
jgi:hypothetical protein